MATKKHKRKAVGKARRGKKRMSGTGAVSELVLTGLGVIGGGLFAAFGIQALDTASGGKVPLAVTRGAMTVAGGIGAYMGRKHPIAMGAGLGAVAVSGAMLSNELGLNVPGIAGIPAVGRANRRMGAALRSVGSPQGLTNRTGIGSMRSLAKIGSLYSN